MVPLAVLVAVAVVACGCARSPDDEPSGPPTELEISVWRAGTDGPVRTTTIRCPASNDTCDRLAALEDPFAPVPKDTVCAQIYGGPQVAEVRGTFRGQKVEARFNRTNSCEIERWNRVAFLFPTT